MTKTVAPTRLAHFNDNLSDIDHDGVAPNTSSDPPGQKSVYILPGDPEDELYRVTTFSKFPSNAVDVRDLARNGFLYTGFRDRVKCFSCGSMIEQWNTWDDPSAKKWHFLNCEFYSGVPRRNRPSGNRFRDLTHPTSSVTRASSNADRGTMAIGRPPIAPLSTTSNHGNHEEMHGDSNIPNQINANMIIVNNYPVSITNQTSVNSSVSQSSSYNHLFSCDNPSNPHMRTIQSRLATYHSGWQSSAVRATPKQLAQSGLFYLGERDRLKCWYCNGGLQNWEYNDDPWFEHAKWFPTCDYLLQTKGPEYVHDVTKLFPNLRRPTVRSPARNQVLSGLNVVESPRRGLDRSPHSTRRSGDPIQIIDPQKEVKKLKRRVNEEMAKSQNLIMAVERMGFKKVQVKAAYMRKLQSGGSFADLEELMDCMINFCGNITSEDVDDDDEDEEMTSYSQRLTQASPLSADEEVRRLEEEKLCKICRERNFEVVFLPCGHLASCAQCSQGATHCPICKVYVTQKVRTYAM